MANTLTKLVISGTPLPPGFKGTPQQFFETMLARMKISAPFGIVTFVSGSNKPTSNQGPWLKDGTQWWVWDDDESDYVPLDISASVTAPYFIQEAEPTTDTDTLVWFKTNGTGADLKIENIYVLLANAWVPILLTTGTTAQRPTVRPDFFRYYDTTISALIWWERGAWRTVDGVKGDLKYVSALSRASALTQNPGWEIFGTGESDNEPARGRILVPAMKDSDGGNPIATSAGITPRNAGSMSGAEEITLTAAQLPEADIKAVNPTSELDLSTKTVIQNTADGDTLNTGQTSVDSGGAANATNVDLKIDGDGDPVGIMNPVFAAFLLRKT